MPLSLASPEEHPYLIESPHRPLRPDDELVGEAGRFPEPVTDGAGKDPAWLKASQRLAPAALGASQGSHAADPIVGSVVRFGFARPHQQSARGSVRWPRYFPPAFTRAFAAISGAPANRDRDEQRGPRCRIESSIRWELKITCAH